MKRLTDDDIAQELVKLGHAFKPSSIQKENIRRSIFASARPKKVFRNTLLPTFISLIVLLSVGVGLFVIIGESELTTGVITDNITPERLEAAPQNEQTFLIEWGSDSMDRGNHDFYTLEHGQLVVSTDFDELQRGQAVYYHMPPSVIAKNSAVPEMYIGRVVGLPGETVEIKGGQVYIDGKRLDTFYGKATMHGLSEEEYFNTVASSRIVDEQSIREYFNMDMAAVTVEENTVFILVDQWWRGYDSREYGPLPIGEIEGIIIGTAE
ncbi:signal peptidase I [Sporosarcina luteola]|uniref:signal peptidase I n=1 Tax=Bacillales TaxID=1385 RepID=UPI00203F075B|nr:MULTISPECIES: signal peptidase I [Bacillales]MCM3638462.1 signal peptidase I [Sporosarcina luteola]